VEKRDLSQPKRGIRVYPPRARERKGTKTERSSPTYKVEGKFFSSRFEPGERRGGEKASKEGIVWRERRAKKGRSLLGEAQGERWKIAGGRMSTSKELWSGRHQDPSRSASKKNSGEGNSTLLERKEVEASLRRIPSIGKEKREKGKKRRDRYEDFWRTCLSEDLQEWGESHLER